MICTPYSKIFLACAGVALLTAAAVGAGENTPAEAAPKPVIILKLDDVTGITPRWKKCADFLKAENVKASFGIIGSGIEKVSPETVAWIKDLNDSGLIEFWNHGYMARSAKDPKGEFESDDVAAQVASLQKTQQLAKEKFGITLHAFGPHWSGVTKATEEALKQVPDITSVFYYTNPKSPWFVFERKLDLETPIFRPNFEVVKKNYEKQAGKKAYFCMQGHANQWDDKSFEEFTKVVRFFKEQGCTFMTATEYVNSVKGKAGEGK